MAKKAVKEKLSVGAQIYQEHSVYEWEGRMITEYEWVVLFKVQEDKIEALAEFIKSNHSYEVPEVVLTRILRTTSEFAEWIRNVKEDKDEKK